MRRSFPIAAATNSTYYYNVIMRTIQLIFSTFLTIIICITPNLAQDMEETEDIFAFVKAPSGNTRAGMMPKSNKKYKTAKKVFDALIEARGDRRMQRPEFVMSRKERYVAWMNPNAVEIGLEEKAFDICMSFGDDSLNVIAIMLGHEIAHYYEKHNWTKHFAKSHGKDLDALELLEGLDEGVRNETEADFAGGFLAYSAGYSTFGKMPEFLDKVYKEYNLDEKLKGYPSLSDRKKISEESEKNLRQLIEVYEMANYMTAIGAYDRAIEYYQYVLKDYQSREIYNNVGVLQVLYAMDNYYTEKELDLYFPVELDLNFRKSTRNADEETKKKREELLQEAIRNFNASLGLDEEYATAQLNKACAYELLGDHQRAAFYSSVEAKQLTQHLKAEVEEGKLNGEDISEQLKKDLLIRSDKTLSDIQVLQGVIAARMAKEASDATEASKLKARAKKIFETEAQEGSHIAKLNQEVFAGNRPSFSSTTGIVSRTEGLTGNQSLEDISEALWDGNIKFDTTLNISKKSQFSVKDFAAKKSKVRTEVYDEGTLVIYLQTTLPGFDQATQKDIKIGDTRKKVTDAYGEPKRYIQLVNGDIMVYKQQSDPNSKFMIFLMEENKLKSWGMAMIEKNDF